MKTSLDHGLGSKWYRVLQVFCKQHVELKLRFWKCGTFTRAVAYTPGEKEGTGQGAYKVV